LLCLECDFASQSWFKQRCCKLKAMATDTTWTIEEQRLRRRIFWVAFVVRVAYLTLAHTYRVRAGEDHFGFGWEMGRIARALVTGFGYADPFNGHTGPTSWSPPLYVLLMAGVFKLFGVYSAMSAWVILVLNSAMSAATAFAVWEIARRCFNAKVALWSGWLWALHPAAMQYAVRWIWEMTASTFLLTWILVLALRMREHGTKRREQEAGSKEQGTNSSDQGWAAWFVFGLLWGVLALTSPTPLILLPVVGLWIAWGPGFSVARLSRIALAGVVFCAVIAPWAARNYCVFHAFIPLRGNFGAENYLGNGPWSVGFPWGTTVPLDDKATLREYTTLGERAWVLDRGAKASAWIGTHHTRFAELSLKRAYMFWAGVPHPLSDGALSEYIRLMSFQFLSLAGLMGVALAVSRRIVFSSVMALAFVLLPITYYLVTVQARFRHPLEPLICICGVYLFQSAEPGRFGSTVAARCAWLGRATSRLRPFFTGAA